MQTKEAYGLKYSTLHALIMRDSSKYGFAVAEGMQVYKKFTHLFKTSVMENLPLIFDPARRQRYASDGFGATRKTEEIDRKACIIYIIIFIYI